MSTTPRIDSALPSPTLVDSFGFDGTTVPPSPKSSSTLLRRFSGRLRDWKDTIKGKGQEKASPASEQPAKRSYKYMYNGNEINIDELPLIPFDSLERPPPKLEIPELQVVYLLTRKKALEYYVGRDRHIADMAWSKQALELVSIEDRLREIRARARWESDILESGGGYGKRRFGIGRNVDGEKHGWYHETKRRTRAAREQLARRSLKSLLARKAVEFFSKTPQEQEWPF
ncbi:hypothetical protein JCM10212_004729 [Sporobolomyces blumeae]